MEDKDIIKLVKSLSVEEWENILRKAESSAEPEPASKKKVRRKHYKKEGQKESGKNVPKTLPQPVRKITRMSSGGDKQRVEAMKQPLKIGPRPNKFENSELFNAYKEDVETDKKLWGGKSPSPRVRQPIEYYQVDCIKCGKTCEVPAARIVFMSDSEYSFICDTCSTRGAV